MTNMVEKKGKKRRSPMDLGIFMYSVFDFGGSSFMRPLAAGESHVFLVKKSEFKVRLGQME